MNDGQLEALHTTLREYVDWTADDAARLMAIRSRLQPYFAELIDDFYEELQRYTVLVRVLQEQLTSVATLKGHLRNWLLELFQAQYDTAYVRRRWQIGWRHAEIGVSQVHANMSFARLRLGMSRCVREILADDVVLQQQTMESLNKALDIENAIIQHAFETEQLRRRTEATRARSEIRFRNLVEAATCMIVILRGDGSVVYFSPFAESITGIQGADLVGRDYFEACVPEDYRQRVRTQWTRAVAGESTQGSESPVTCRDSQVRWLVWNARKIDEVDGEALVLMVGHDITERKYAERRLVQAERLAAIGQMITGLAHESRNALQRINSSTEMLEFEVEGNEEALALVRRSQKALDDIRRLFDEVRNYAAPLQLEIRRQSLDSAWREAWDILVHSRRDRDVELAEELGAADLSVPIDRFRIVQVFRNLFENTLAACEDPVRVTIACLDRRVDGIDMLEVAVHDNGPGFTPEARTEALNPFFTTKTKGTGLGLAIVQRLVNAHGGSVEIRVPQQGGAEVVLLFPRGAEPVEPPLPDVAAEGSTSAL